MAIRIIVVGGVAAGAKAAGRCKRFNPEAEVILIQDEREISYTACGQPYYIGGIITERRELIIQSPEELRSKGIDVHTGCRAESIDVEARKVSVCDLQEKTLSELTFDRLILATGAKPIVPPMPGTEFYGVVTLRSIAELDLFKSVLDKLKPRHAVILGSGYIGIEVAENLAGLGISVTILEKMDRIMPRMDPEMSQQIHQHLLDHGIELITGIGATEIVGLDGCVSAVRMDNGREINAQLVVVAVGISPNISLAVAAGLMIGSSGAIAVNERMQTSVDYIYAAGDCAESIHRLTGKPVWNPLGDIANLQGRVAGENAGGGHARFPGVLGTSIFKAVNLNVAITGLTEQAASSAGMTPLAVTLDARDKARYYPGAKSVTVKLLADKVTGKLLGAQIIGVGAVDKSIDIVATGLLGGLTCRDIEYADFAYAPPYSPVLSPIIVAAGILAKRVGKN